MGLIPGREGGYPEGILLGGSGRRALGMGGFGQGMGPPAFPWRRWGVSAEDRPPSRQLQCATPADLSTFPLFPALSGVPHQVSANPTRLRGLIGGRAGGGTHRQC